MNWIEIKENDWIALECTNTKETIYVIRFSPAVVINRTTNESGIDLPNNESGMIKRIIPIRYTHHPELSEVKNDAINLQKDFDKSYEVNSFKFYNDRYWFTKEERLALINSFNVLKEFGETTGILWLGTIKLPINLDRAISFINDLELYAIECNNVTRNHINSINDCETIEEVAAFDITDGYPQQLELSIV